MDKAESQRERGKRMLSESGYHDDAAQDRKLIEGMVKPTALKRARGGATVHGRKGGSRPDKRGRGPHTVVNVIAGKPGGDDPAKMQMAAHAGMQKGVQIGAQLGAKAVAQKLQGGGGGPPPPGAMPGPGPGMPPPGGAPMPPPGPMGAKNGGTIKVKAHERRRGGALRDSGGTMPEAD